MPCRCLPYEVKLNIQAKEDAKEVTRGVVKN